MSTVKQDALGDFVECEFENGGAVVHEYLGLHIRCRLVLQMAGFMEVPTSLLEAIYDLGADILIVKAQWLQDEVIDAVLECSDHVLRLTPVAADDNYRQEVHVVVITTWKTPAYLAQKGHTRRDPWLDRSMIGLDLQIKQHVAEASAIETGQPFFERFGMDVIVSKGSQQVSQFGCHVGFVLHDQSNMTIVHFVSPPAATARPEG